MIRVEGLAISFSHYEKLLEEVNFTVNKAETFVLIGPSGSGKSVILKTLCGLIKPSRGRVSLFEKDINRLSRSEQVSILNKVGMLFQKNALFDSLTVGENLAFPMRENGEKSESKIDATVDEYLAHVGLSHAKNLFPDEISGGMQKRVGIARALILQPEIILYDDPTAGLDPITSRLIIELILKCKRDFGTTIVAITNDMNRAYQMADRMAIIRDHSLVVTGTVTETKNSKDLRVQQFIHGRAENVS
jgi:phospholipid/cholesterol/gamma-HCH transport system ATP-binding protein